MVHEAPPIACVVLCAGGSRRMGRTKALLPLQGRPLVSHHIESLRAFGPVTVVLGSSASEVRSVLASEVVVVENKKWASTEMIDSLRLALLEGDIRGACLVTPVDVAPPSPEIVAALIRRGAPAVPTDSHGRRGHPVLLDASLVAAIRDHAPEGGLREILAAAQEVAVRSGLVALDFDTPEAWAEFASSRQS